VDSYRQAIRLDPTNEAAKQALQTAEQKLQSEATSTVKSNEAGAAAAAAAKGPTAPGGGMDFASLLSNPQLMSMASEFMKNPAAGQMLQGLMGGGSGANPSGGASPASAGGNSNSSSGNNPLSGLLNNPQLMSMAQQFMSDPKMRDMLGGLGSGPSAGGSGSK
jgi:small glutamine-rich tetratricopeptide repeat-containing protein alpha